MHPAKKERADRDWQAHCLDKKQLAFYICALYIFYVQHISKLLVAPGWQVDSWEGLPAVSYNVLANSLEEKILHVASACTVFEQQKMIKVSLKMISCVAFCGGFLILGERKQCSRWLKQEEEAAMAERQERLGPLRESPGRSDLGLWLLLGILATVMSLGHGLWLVQAASQLCLPGSLLTGPQSLLFPQMRQGMPRAKERGRWDGAKATAFDPLFVPFWALGSSSSAQAWAGATILLSATPDTGSKRSSWPPALWMTAVIDPWSTLSPPCLREGLKGMSTICHFWAEPLSRRVGSRDAEYWQRKSSNVVALAC